MYKEAVSYGIFVGVLINKMHNMFLSQIAFIRDK
jgi:hypothetical protein